MDIKVVHHLVTTPVSRDANVPWLDESTDKIKLEQPFSFVCNDMMFVIPAGYITDSSSIPRIFWWLFPPHYTEAREASCAHDYIYSHLYHYYSKKFADDLFEAFMKKNKAPWLVRKLFYWFVRIFGRGGWSYSKNPLGHEHWRIKHENTTYPVSY